MGQWGGGGGGGEGGGWPERRGDSMGGLRQQGRGIREAGGWVIQE